MRGLERLRERCASAQAGLGVGNANTRILLRECGRKLVCVVAAAVFSNYDFIIRSQFRYGGNDLLKTGFDMPFLVMHRKDYREVNLRCILGVCLRSLRAYRLFLLRLR